MASVGQMKKMARQRADELDGLANQLSGRLAELRALQARASKMLEGSSQSDVNGVSGTVQKAIAECEAAQAQVRESAKVCRDYAERTL